MSLHLKHRGYSEDVEEDVVQEEAEEEDLMYRILEISIQGNTE